MNFARLFTGLGPRKLLASSFHSPTPTPTPMPMPMPMPARHIFGRAGNDSMSELYRRITPIGDPKVSIVPILDQWVQEGRPICKDQLRTFIKEFRYYKRFHHALEISLWMTDKRYCPLTSVDSAVRLDLISLVHGNEEADKFFNNIPQKIRGLEVYSTRLNCYARAKSVEKAEAVLQKMRDLGFARETVTYNVMLNLYYQIGNREKFDALIHEMEENGIAYDRFTLGIQLSAYAAVSDIEGMEKIITKMESGNGVVLDWIIYSNAANAYTKAGLLDKALEMLRKCEGLVSSKKRSRAYDSLLTQYAATGKKDEVLRIWELYKKKEKIYNKGYSCIISSLLKFDDIESAEKIFEEWESQHLQYDVRVPNFLIAAYSRKGDMERAESLLKRIVSKGREPDYFSWFNLAEGYFKNNQTSNALEMMKKAILACGPGWKPTSESLASFLGHLKGKGDFDKAEEFLKLLVDKDIISLDVQERLLNCVKANESSLVSRTET